MTGRPADVFVLRTQMQIDVWYLATSEGSGVLERQARQVEDCRCPVADFTDRYFRHPFLL
jgi:hypothetical protein